MLELADDMEKDAAEASRDDDRYFTPKEVRSWAKQIRRAVKAAEGEPNQQNLGLMLAPEMQHVLEIEKAKAEFRGKIKTDDGSLAEEIAETMMEIVSGPAEGTFVKVAGGGKPGMKTVVDGAVYQIGASGNRLLFNATETAELKKKMESKIVVPGETT
jgi:hypothetical protein